MTACELYYADTTFQLLVDEWAATTMVPDPLIDRLLDLEMYKEAAAAKWFKVRIRYPVMYYPYGVAMWGWWVYSEYYAEHSIAGTQVLPDNLFKPTDGSHIWGPSKAIAMCLVLDNWKGPVEL